jgi:hypothetical protein
MVIDLGELPAVAEDAPAVPPSRPRHVRVRRDMLLILLAVAFVAAGSGVPAGLGLPVVARIPIGVNARLLITGTTAIVSDRRADRNEVAAYDLGTGRPLWRSPLAGTSSNAQMFVASSTVVVQTQHDVGYDQIEGFSVATGARRWRMPALMATAIPVGLLIYQRAGGEDIDAVLIDPVTGAQRWRTPLGGDCDFDLASDPAETMAAGLVEICEDTQRIVAIDLATGRIRARADAGLLPRPKRPRPIQNVDTTRLPPELSIAYLGAITIVAVPRRYPSRVLSGFRTSDLSPLWLGVEMTRNGQLHACGVDVCDDQGSAFDPRTGRGVTTPPAPAAAPVRFRPPPGTIETLLVVPPGVRYQATGADAAAPVEARTPRADGQSAAVHAPEAGAVWIAVPGRYGIRPLLLVPDTAASACAAITAYVACTTALDQITIWSLRRG